LGTCRYPTSARCQIELSLLLRGADLLLISVQFLCLVAS
jgi:hypothetical protein